MVDFSKRITPKASNILLDPIEIYETLDRASDKGPPTASTGSDFEKLAR